tara:strand:+ start:377 stop:502 length:126 start_codon:yes stop_codon:yes gene_type:complete
MKYLLILFFVAITFASCSKGDGEDISPCHDFAPPTEQDSNQ